MSYGRRKFSPPASSMDPFRSIRAPSTILKTSKTNLYSSDLPQTRLRLITSTEPRAIASSLRPISAAGQSRRVDCSSEDAPHEGDQTITSARPANNVTTRTASPAIPKPVSAIPHSGLVRPANFNYSVSPASSSSIKPPARREAPKTVTKSRPSATSSNISRPKALTSQLTRPTAFRSSSSNIAPTNLPGGIASRAKPELTTTTTVTTTTLTSTKKRQSAVRAITPTPTSREIGSSLPKVQLREDLVILNSNSIADDVGQMRVLLEQLVDIIKSSDEGNERLVDENKRLRREVAELKARLAAIKSATASVPVTDYPIAEDPRESTEDGSGSRRRETECSVYKTPLR